MYYENPDGVSVHDGFPNPATDSSLQTLDFNTLLITHSATTYCMRLRGSNWQPYGIFDNDLVIIDRSLTARPNDLVVWHTEDRFVISRCHEVGTGSSVWGVVTATIHQYRKTRGRA